MLTTKNIHLNCCHCLKFLPFHRSPLSKQGAGASLARGPNITQGKDICGQNPCQAGTRWVTDISRHALLVEHLLKPASCLFCSSEHTCGFRLLKLSVDLHTKCRSISDRRCGQTWATADAGSSMSCRQFLLSTKSLAAYFSDLRSPKRTNWCEIW